MKVVDYRPGKLQAFHTIQKTDSSTPRQCRAILMQHQRCYAYLTIQIFGTRMHSLSQLLETGLFEPTSRGVGLDERAHPTFNRRHQASADCPLCFPSSRGILPRWAFADPVCVISARSSRTRAYVRTSIVQGCASYHKRKRVLRNPLEMI
jgi:hypothetical protein